MGEVNNVINSNISALNSAYYNFDTATDQDRIVVEYMDQQAEVHKVKFDNEDDFKRTQSLDISILIGMINGDVSRFEDVDFFGTVCYCLDKFKAPDDDVQKVKQLINSKIEKINSKKS